MEIHRNTPTCGSHRSRMRNKALGSRRRTKAASVPNLRKSVESAETNRRVRQKRANYDRDPFWIFRIAVIGVLGGNRRTLLIHQQELWEPRRTNTCPPLKNPARKDAEEVAGPLSLQPTNSDRSTWNTRTWNPLACAPFVGARRGNPIYKLPTTPSLRRSFN